LNLSKLNPFYKHKLKSVNFASIAIILWAIIFSIILSLPVIYLFLKITFGINLFVDFIFNYKILKIALNSILLVFLVVFLATAIALPLAFLNVRTNLPFAKYLLSISVLPIALPSYVMATTQIELWGPRGIVYDILSNFFEIAPLPSFYGLSGSVIVLGLITYPYIYIGLCATFRRFDFQMIDASRTLGASVSKTFNRIIIPLVLPTIASGSLLVSLYVLSDFGAVALLRFNTFTIAIFNRMYSSIGNYGVLELCSLVIVFCFIILFIESRSRTNSRYFSNSTSVNLKILDLGYWKWVILPFALLPTVLGFLLPVMILLYWLISGIFFETSFINVYEDLFSEIIGSVTISLISSIIITFLATIVVLIIRKKIRVISFIIEKTSYIGLSLPGIVVAMSLVFFTINYLDFIYQTYIVLIFGYLISFLPAALTPVKSSVSQIDPSLEEASYSLGKGKVMTFYNVIVKLSIPGVSYGGVLVFILCIKELPLTLILSPLGFSTLATSIWSSASEAFFMDTAAASLVLILVAGIPTYIFMSNNLSKKVGL
tara:strand:- start:603 stop:2234 length:1632 start_codon:yes stop_codon:yes gene_type:complete